MAASREAQLAQRISQLTCNEFQELCQQLVWRGSLKEATYGTADELLTALTSSLGEDETYELVNTLFDVISHRVRQQGPDCSAESQSQRVGPKIEMKRTILIRSFSEDGVLRYREIQMPDEYAQWTLQLLRTEFISSMPLSHFFLSDFQTILSSSETATILSKPLNRKQRATSLIDTVLRKGPEASQQMLRRLKQINPGFFQAFCISQERKLQRLQPAFVSQAPFSQLVNQLLEDLRKAHVLDDRETEEFQSASDLKNKAQSLIDVVLNKGPQASHIMMFFLHQRGFTPSEVSSDEGEVKLEDRLKLLNFREPPVFRSELFSRQVLIRLMDKLWGDRILDFREKSMIISSSPDTRSMVFHLNHLVILKGPEASMKMSSFLKYIEPRLYDHCFIDLHKDLLINKIADVDKIINELNLRGVATSEDIKAIQSPRKKMSKVMASLKTVNQKLTFCSVLQEREPQALEAMSMKMEREPSCKHFEMATAKWFAGTETVAEDEWTQLKPHVSHDDDGCTWYSFTCVPGKYECSVSSMRWICKASPLKFKYRFGNWWELEDKMKALQYMPAGPLLDVIVTHGQFDEVYLPHWICTTVEHSALEFAVVCSDVDGVTVEKVSEVTPSHVKLPHPVFSARGVLLRILRWIGFPVSLKCKVLIYRTRLTFLTLHVYVIPKDPAVEADLRKKAEKKGYESIDKPYPQGTLQMDAQVTLITDVIGARITPDTFKFTYESWDPNWIEVYMERPGEIFTLKLKNAAATVWKCDIRQFDYSCVGLSLPEMMTYDEELQRVRSEFVERVGEEVLNQLMDNLLGGVLNAGEKDAIIEENPTVRNKARALIDRIVKKGAIASRRMIFHLQRRDRTLHGLLQLPYVPAPENS